MATKQLLRADGVDWTFGGTWPFEPRWFETRDGRMHFVDVGPRDAPPIVMVHGNPTWGYVWRNFITALCVAGFRCVVPDHLGFGRSDKPGDSHVYAFPKHAARLEALLESLDLHRVTLVVQDWGASTGVYWLSRHIERVANLVVLNGLAHPLAQPLALYGFLRVLRTSIAGELAEKGLSASVRFYLFHHGIQHPERFSPVMRVAYLAPFPTWTSRTAMLQFPRSIPVNPSDPDQAIWREMHEALCRLRDDQVLIIWPMKDPGFTPALLEQYWVKDFPSARVLRIEDAGHYIQEDAWERVVPEIAEFLFKRNSEPALARHTS